MIPYPYNMVDMNGIDLAEANGAVVEGLYAKIVEAVNACGDAVLYNWKFAGIEIAPQHTSILLGDPIIINGAIQVTESDMLTIPSNFQTEELIATENSIYVPDPPVMGYNPVTVNVPPREVLTVPLLADTNGIYDVPEGYDGFGRVTVDVPLPASSVYTNYSYPTQPFEISTPNELLLNTYRKTNGDKAYGGYRYVSGSTGYMLVLASRTNAGSRFTGGSNSSISYEGTTWYTSYVSFYTISARGVARNLRTAGLVSDLANFSRWIVQRVVELESLGDIPVYCPDDGQIISTPPDGYAGFGTTVYI